MKSSKARLVIILSGGLFLLLDQFLKWQAAHLWSKPVLLLPYFGWQPYLNRGAAFSLPVSNLVVALFTAPMICLVAYLSYRNYKKNILPALLGWSLVLAGAISNLVDRIFYGHVIDYFLVATGIINIGDVLIVGGLIIFLFRIGKRT